MQYNPTIQTREVRVYDANRFAYVIVRERYYVRVDSDSVVGEWRFDEYVLEEKDNVEIDRG